MLFADLLDLRWNRLYRLSADEYRPMPGKRKRTKHKRKSYTVKRKRSSSVSSMDDEAQEVVVASKAVSRTPQLDKVMEYAKSNRKTKLVRALQKLYQFVGADDLKESFAESIQYYICTNVQTQVRRSKRRKFMVRKKPTSARDMPSSDSGEDDDDDDDSDAAEMETMVAGSKIQDVLFRLILAEKLKTMIGEKSDTDDDSDYDPDDNSKTHKKELKLKKLHTCLLGAPGTGKTSFAKIIVDVWDALKIVDKNKFFITGRGDWVAKYHGHSAQKAKRLIRKAKGGVIFIDEAYSLIGCNGDDLFGSEVLTTIVEAMTSPEKDVVFIMAGYKDKMDRIFKSNAGLERRFSYIYEMQKPSVEHIVKIFQNQVRVAKWKLRAPQDVVLQFFRQNTREFAHAGGSTEKFLDYCQHAAASRCFPERTDKKIEACDLHTAIVRMRATDQKMRRLNLPPQGMYM